MASKEITCCQKSYSLSYQILNPKCKESILILHGWGSNKELMYQAFAKSFTNFRHIYLDMPGFGNSSEPQIPIDTYEYAKVVQEFLKALEVNPQIIMGHSFGGKVATLLNPQILVLLSSAGIVLPKSLRVRVKIALFKLFKSFLPKKTYKLFASKDVESMSERMYEVFKKVVDEDFSPVFEKCTSKALLFWGKEDKATPLISGKKIEGLIQDASLYELEGDHYFFLKSAKEIEVKLLEALA